MGDSITLVSLGGLEVQDAAGAPVALSPKRLALLAYLAVARPRGPHQRDSLLALFYPESDTTHARSAFRHLLHEVRLALGDDLLPSRPRETVAANHDLLRCDVWAFEEALAHGDFQQTVALYAGPFLSGFHLNGCPGFEQWAEGERGRLQRAVTGSLEQLALSSMQRGDSRNAAVWWQQLLAHEPYASHVTLGLMEALADAGDRAAALQAAQDHAARMKRDFGAEPSSDVAAFADRLKTQPPGRAQRRPAVAERLSAALAGRYAIEELIGVGGMALVYRAKDLKHERSVALKVLRPELAAALGSERFLREIAIAARLNHPNILPLHDSGAADDLLYYVMPFIEGESLRERLTRDGPLPFEEAVRLAGEVAEALEYAHAEGVVHRDIKPENILISSGHALVADFGVARAAFEAGGRLTDMGTTVGTPIYMSLEQASGAADIDARTDIYSLACVLYEMLAGAPPYTGPNVQAIVAQKLSQPTPGVSLVRQRVPQAVAETIDRALAKAPADRFSTAQQFATELGKGLPGAGAENPWSSRTRLRLVAQLAFAALLVAAGTMLVVSRGWLSGRTQQIRVLNIRQLTWAPGVELYPAISPDGKEVAYAAGSPLDLHLHVQDVVGGRVLALTADRPGNQILPQWAADGHNIIFVDIGPGGVTFQQISRLGGPAQQVVAIGTEPPSYAWKDGRTAFVSGDGLFIRGFDNDEPRLLARVGPGAHSLAWSPDGSLMAYVEGNTDWVTAAPPGNVAPSTIWTVPVSGGDPTRVTHDASLNASPVWTPDAKHLLFISDRDGPRGLYAVRVDAVGRTRGGAMRVEAGLEPHSLSLSADGRTLAYSRLTSRSNIVRIAVPASGSVSIGDAEPVTMGNQTVENHDVSNDGQWLTYDSNLEGNQDIYLVRLDGGEPRRLTANPADDFAPDFSPDGREIVFHSNRHGTRDIFLISVEGGDETRLTDDPGQELLPKFSPDGLHVIYARGPLVGGPQKLYIISRDSVGGEWNAPRLVWEPGFYGEWSPDGQMIAVTPRGEPGMWLVTPDGQEQKRVDMGNYGGFGPTWSPDGQFLRFVGGLDNGQQGVFEIAAAGGPVRQLIRFDDQTMTPVFPVSVGPGDVLYLTVAEIESDIYLANLAIK